MRLALFDFDGTLTTKDTLEEFLKYSTSRQQYLINMLLFSPMFILYKLGIIKNNIAKERLISMFFKGYTQETFTKLAQAYSEHEIDKIINKYTYKKLLQHLKNKDRVLIVSASIECWIKPWSDKQKVELLSTRLEFKNGEFTGKFATKNCHGEEKVTRIKSHLNLDKYDEIYAYGDSSGDKEMLKLAKHTEWIKHS